MDFAQVTTWFGRYTPILERFGRDRGLTIEKYFHDAPGWRFKFAHPQSGYGAVDLWRISDDLCHVDAIAWIDDERAGTRALRSRKTRVFAPSDDLIEKELNLAIDDVLSWRPNE